MSAVKARVDIRAGQIELEGDKDFVQANLDKFRELMAQRGQKSEPDEDEAAADADESSNGKDTKIKRRRPKGVAGDSCRDRILKLKEDGFFAAQRTPADIVKGLAAKGWTNSHNQVTAALTPMFETGQLKRTSDGKGFKYFWDVKKAA